MAHNALGPVDLFDLDELPEVCRTGMLIARLSPRQPDPCPGPALRLTEPGDWFDVIRIVEAGAVEAGARFA